MPVNYGKSIQSKEPLFIVKIGPDMSLEIDGKVVEIKRASVRALFSLALMRDKKSFTTAEFSKIYYGDKRTEGELASEFTTAIRDVKRLVPGLGYESDSKKQRTVSGVFCQRPPAKPEA